LLKKGKDYQDKKNLMNEEIKVDEVKDCTFKPKINMYKKEIKGKVNSRMQSSTNGSLRQNV
jgi:hypothetical protein